MKTIRISGLATLIIIFTIIWACGGTEAEERRKVSVNGQKIFRQHCVLCHGVNGKLQLNGARDLTASVLTLEERVSLITNGKNMMTAFGGLLSEEEIKAVAEYTMTFSGNE